MPDTREGRAAQTTGGDNDVRGARKTRRYARDVRLAMRAAHREPRQRACSQAAGVVNVLALAVTFHSGGADLAWSIETPRMDRPLQALTSLSGTRPNRVSAPYRYAT